MGKHKYTCIIVDDETLAQDLISTHISEISEVEVKGKFHNPVDAQGFLELNNIDIVFLDIEMPNMNGLEFIRSLSSSPKIILTTAYAEFALDGFALNVVDYLLKPIVFDRFENATRKAIHLLNLEQQSEKTETNVESNSIVIKSNHELIKINLEDIIYVEGLHKYIKIVTSQGKYTTLFGLTAMYDELPKMTFFRCHRSFILNINRVEKISQNDAIMGQYNVPISKGNKPLLLEKLGKQLR